MDFVVMFLMLYLFVNFISFALNPKVAVIDSISEIFRFLSFLAMYLLGRAFFKSHPKRDLILASYVISVICIDAIGYCQLASGSFHTSRKVLAIQGTFDHPNMYANFLNLANLACIYFLLQKKYVTINSIIIVLNVFLLFNTYSRMAIAVCALMILILALVYRKQSVYVFLLVVMVGLFIVYKHPHIIDFWAHRFSTIGDPNAIIESRSYIFTSLIYLFKQNLLIGIGPATFYPHYYHVMPHNELLRNLAEVGLLGTIPFVFMWGTIVKRFFSFDYFVKRSRYDQQKLFIFLMILVVIITSLTANIGTQQELLWPLFLLFGSYGNREEKKHAGHEHIQNQPIIRQNI